MMKLNPNLCRIQPPVTKAVRGYDIKVRQQLNGMQQIKLDAELSSVRDKFTEEDEQKLTQQQLMQRFLYVTAARVKYHILIDDDTPLFQEEQSLDDIIEQNDNEWLDDLYRCIGPDAETVSLSDAEKNS